MKFYFYEINRMAMDKGGIVELETLFRSENLGDAIVQFKEICADEKRTINDWLIKLTNVRVILSRFKFDVYFSAIEREFQIENVDEESELMMEDIDIE